MDKRSGEAQGCAASATQRFQGAKSDHRISLIRDALLKTRGLHLADSEIRTLLAAIDVVGVPLPYAGTVTVGAREPDIEFLSLTFEFPEPHVAPFAGAMSPYSWEQTR